MANDENLKPVRSKSEARERGQNGGKASGKARAKLRTLKDTLKALLATKTEIDGAKLTEHERMCLALIQEANKGNVRAFEAIRDTIGEKPVSNVNLGSDDESLKEIKISFVDKSTGRDLDEDPKIVGDYTPPVDT